MQTRKLSQAPAGARPHHASRLASAFRLAEDLKGYGHRHRHLNAGELARFSSLADRFPELDAELVERQNSFRRDASRLRQEGKPRAAERARKLAETFDEVRRMNSLEQWMLHRFIAYLSLHRDGCSPELLERCCERMLLRQEVRCSDQTVLAIAEGRNFTLGE